jgi:hypothetical protein
MKKRIRPPAAASPNSLDASNKWSIGTPSLSNKGLVIRMKPTTVLFTEAPGRDTSFALPDCSYVSKAFLRDKPFGVLFFSLKVKRQSVGARVWR